MSVSMTTDALHLRVLRLLGIDRRNVDDFLGRQLDPAADATPSPQGSRTRPAGVLMRVTTAWRVSAAKRTVTISCRRRLGGLEAPATHRVDGRGPPSHRRPAPR
jgi:hypothetical protein